MIRSILITANGEKSRDIPTGEITAALKHKDSLLWICMEAASNEEVQSILSGQFHFHPLAIEDCLNDGYQTPKVDDFGSYLYLIIHTLQTDPDSHFIQTNEVNLFIGENYLVTVVHQSNLEPLRNIWKRLERDERLLQNGSDFLSYGIIDEVIDDYLPLLDRMDDELEALEDQVLARPAPSLLERLLEIKHSLIYLRRVISPEREVINRLTRDEFPMIDLQSRIYFRDIYDHLVRYQDMIESLRDIVGGALDIYLNSTSLRMNEIMKALTIVSTIFLPLSFVAGVYGMNFDFMPELHARFGYPLIWGIFILIPLGMLIFFKKRGWF